ncbi:MAG: hypothetical protein JW743_02320 [Deltaproteobacteria bacterium]|nr:hypothetical protein [Deltaproteobacteria bacterium]MBN2845465.1 hypothetical protein [Deltaproteobacteria bacterium]
MKKLLLLDADVIIDLHTLGLFEKITKNYEIWVTRTVLGEAQYFKNEGRREGIDISNKVTVIDDVALDSLKEVQQEAKEARLGIDPGELESIAYMCGTEEEITFCTCDKAAIKLISYMRLESKSMSVEKALKGAGHHKKNLYPRHFEKMFKESIKDGETLRIQFKKLI